MKLNRLSLLRKLAPITAVAMVLAPQAAWADCSPPVQPDGCLAGWTAQQAPGFYRFRLGDFRMTVLSDGTAPRDLTTILSKPAEVREALEASHEAIPVEISINCFLIDTGTNKILVDTGAGELFGSTSGTLIANLLAAGYRPEDIDTILLTHIHGDHSGGLTIGGKRLFPNATVYVDRRDPAYWLSADAEAHAGPHRKMTFVQSHQTVDPYVSALELRTFDGATELFPGVRTVPEYGHTPGLSGYMIESRGQHLLLWGDIIHAVVQFQDPTITVDYDVDPKQAATARDWVLNDAAKQGYLVGGAFILSRARPCSFRNNWLQLDTGTLQCDSARSSGGA